MLQKFWVGCTNIKTPNFSIPLGFSTPKHSFGVETLIILKFFITAKIILSLRSAGFEAIFDQIAYTRTKCETKSKRIHDAI